MYSRSVDPAYLNNFEPKVLNVFYWNIVKNDGSGPPQLSAEDYLRAQDDLNNAFSNFNICFNLNGFEIYKNDIYETWPSTNFISLVNHMKGVGKYKDDAINVYLYRSSAAAGVSSSKNAIGVGKWQFKNDPLSQVLVHEMGHQLGLSHTYIGWQGNSCEHVTRDINDPDYNATDINGNPARGDKIHDTNAAPDLRQEQREHGIKALVAIGFTTLQARIILTDVDGFVNHPEAILIENGLLDYGFTPSEVNVIKFNGVSSFAYFNINSCIYNPDSRINDPDSPFFKDCQKTPYQFFQSDIRNFMSSTGQDCTNQFSTGQGIHMHEFIDSDNTDYFFDRFTQKPYDLSIRDSYEDIGQEPNIHTDNVLWHSPDLWVRNQNDGQTNQVHQNPEYDPVIPNFLYVRITNKGCSPSSGNDELKLYWAKANTQLLWDLHWNGTLFVNGILMGDQITTLNVPIIQPGEEIILEAEWLVPDPEDYIGINVNPWHFCLLARIESENDPMTVPEVEFLPHNVRNNNNIAWKNTTVIDIIPNTPTIGGLVAVSNPFTTTKTYTLELFSDSNESGKAIYDEAEVTIEMDEILFNAWEIGNKTGANFNTTSNEKKLIAAGNNVLFDNIQLAPQDFGTVYLTFNFLTKELTDKTTFTYHVIQRDKSTNQIVGGETYEIRKQPRPGFTADAGDDKEVERNESVTLQAETINEDAVYNWYDTEGNLIATGSTLTISPEFSNQYKLEIISDLDGLKDYDDISVTINPYRIISISPNPTNSQVTVNYQVDGANSSYVMIVNQNTGNSENYILDTSLNTVNIDLSHLSTALYSVILIADGEIQDSKNLLKN